MVSLRIPSAYRAALASIARMSDADTDSLVGALSDEQVGIGSFSKLAERIRSRVSLKTTGLDDVVDALKALYSVRLGNEQALDIFIRDVSAAMRRGDSEAEKIIDAEAQTLENRLGQLLNIESLTVACKASDLQFGYERVFESARIFTDIRPVFGGDSTSDVRGAVIINQLRISCDEGPDVKDFFFALDQDDLAALKKIVERAEAKSKTLAALLLQAGVNDLGSNKV
jgi:hypothetical protein